MMSILPLLLMAGSLVAAEGPDSGPPVAARPEPLPALVTVGAKPGETTDLVAERGARPTLYVLVRADRWDRSMARFVRSLDRALQDGGPGLDEAELVLVWLTDDVAAARDYQPRGQMSLNLGRASWAVFVGSPLGPNGWSLHPDAFLTVVGVRDGMVTGHGGFLSVGEDDLAPVLKWLAKP